jgi:hypothetical protein
MKAIFDFIIDNRYNTQVHNQTTQQFRAYIFDEAGEYQPHGGKQVSEFIDDALKLMYKGAKR